MLKTQYEKNKFQELSDVATQRKWVKTMKYDLNNKTNRFAERTLLAFSSTLMAILETKEFEKITVGEICDACNFPQRFLFIFIEMFDILYLSHFYHLSRTPFKTLTSLRVTLYLGADNGFFNFILPRCPLHNFSRPNALLLF